MDGRDRSADGNGSICDRGRERGRGSGCGECAAV